ncbi:MAG: cytochrome P450 [Steroidobacter sp.]
MTMMLEGAVQGMRREPPTIASQEVESQPHRVFRLHRALTPVVKRDDGVYVALRASDVVGLVTDARTRQMETEMAASRGVVEGALFDFFKHTMLLSNGLDHRRRRMPVARAFAYNLITQLRPRIRAIAHQIIDTHLPKGRMNLVEDFASWVPARVICEILGIPPHDIPEFTRHVYKLARALSSSFKREDVPELQEAARELSLYTRGLLQDRRARPAADFLTSYVAALDESEQLSAVEALIQIVTLILAGSDTTRGAIAIQVSLLLQHPWQWVAVCRDAALIPGAVAECLRYEPSVGSFMRIALEDIELDGWTIPRNSMLSLSTLSAMRDPALYFDPDRFDITRTDHPRKHLVFGGGVHYCLGAALAMAELEECLAALTERLPHLQLGGEPLPVRGSGGIRTIGDIQVRWPV